MNDDLAGMTAERLREALQLLGWGTPRGGSGRDLPSGRSGAGRTLRQALRTPGFVRRHLEQAPPRAREAFSTLASDGPRSVEALLGRGWWGRGLLPPPLDWLQRRGLVVVGADGLVHAVAPAVEGWRAQTLELVPDEPQEAARAGERSAGVDAPVDGGGDRVPTPPPASEQPRQRRLHLVGGQDEDPPDGRDRDRSGGWDRNVPGGSDASGAQGQDPPGEADHDPHGAAGRRPVSIESAGAVVVAEHPEDIRRVIAVPEAGLTEVAPTVAVTRLRPDALADALRAAGVPLQSDARVRTRAGAPALPGNAERAVTPWDLRELFGRALDEGRQLHLTYYPSSRGGAATERTVDPWRFTDDLLVGWCHLRTGERTFALDRVGSATLLSTPLEHRPDGPAERGPAPGEPL